MLGHGKPKLLRKLGEGAFGAVFRARDSATGALLAVKCVNVDMRSDADHVLRELRALRQMTGLTPYVVPILGSYARGGRLHYVMPLVKSSLSAILSARNFPLPELSVASISRMLLSGVMAIHGEGLVHRDIKPANLLVSESGVLMLADMGQTRELPKNKNAPLSHAVATRWYRAPELLFGAIHYGPGVDVWACGCVIAQLLTLSPLLPGETDIDQLIKVIQFLGSPTPARWPGVDALPDYGKIQLPDDVPPTPLRRMIPSASELALQLVAPMLVYDAPSRATPSESLHTPFLRQSQSDRPPSLDELLEYRRGAAAGPSRPPPRPAADGNSFDPGGGRGARPNHRAAAGGRAAFDRFVAFPMMLGGPRANAPCRGRLEVPDTTGTPPPPPPGGPPPPPPPTE